MYSEQIHCVTESELDSNESGEMGMWYGTAGLNPRKTFFVPLRNFDCTLRDFFEHARKRLADMNLPIVKVHYVFLNGERKYSEETGQPMSRMKAGFFAFIGDQVFVSGNSDHEKENFKANEMREF